MTRVSYKTAPSLGPILVIDDHPIIATACRLVLESVGIGNVVAAYDAASGYQAFLQHKPAVVLVDLSLKGEASGGLALITRIRADDPEAHILAFSMHADRGSFVSAIEAGATGYLVKDASPDELVQAVQEARSGRHYIDAQLALTLAFPDKTLSSRERQVLAILLAGTPYAAIARLLEDRSSNLH